MTSLDKTPEPFELSSTAVKPRSARRRWWVTACLAVLIFLGGAVTGGGFATMRLHHALHDFLHHPEKIPDLVLPRLRRDLGLNEDQFHQVNRIIRQHHQQLDQVRREAVSQVQKEFDALDREMNENLDERQRDKWKHRFHHVREMWFPMSNPGRPD